MNCQDLLQRDTCRSHPFWSELPSRESDMNHSSFLLVWARWRLSLWRLEESMAAEQRNRCSLSNCV